MRHSGSSFGGTPLGDRHWGISSDQARHRIPAIGSVTRTSRLAVVLLPPGRRDPFEQLLSTRIDRVFRVLDSC